MKKIFQNPFFPIFLAPIILFSPVLFTGKALFWGTSSTQFVPWWEFAWSTILDGNLPLWNPWVGMGAPLAANYQSALFYPPYWIHFILFALGGIKLIAWGIAVIVVCHIIWAGIGTAKLLGELNVGKLGQSIGGLAFSLSGYLISRAGFLSINAVAAWIPWILLLTKKLPSGKKKFFWVSGLVFGFQFLAGHAQTAWYSVLLGGVWITFWAFKEINGQSRAKNLFRSWVRYIGAGIVGLAISAIQIIPTLEYLLQSQRSVEFGYSEAMTYSFWPWRFLTLIVPDLFGSPASGNYWGYGNFWEDALYIGLFPIVIAAGLIIRSVGKSTGQVDRKIHTPGKGLVYFLVGIIGTSFVLALGKNTFIFPFLYRNVPSFDLFQAPTRFSIWAEISLAILAGMGVDQLTKPKGKRLYWARLAVAGCFAISAGAGLAWFFLDDIKSTFIQGVGKTGLWALVFALVILFLPEDGESRKRKIWNGLVIGLVGLDLIVAGWGLNPGIDLKFYEKQERKTYDARILMPESIEYDLKYDHFFTFDSFFPEDNWMEMHDYLIPNLNMLQRVEMVNNFDPMVPGRYQNWMDELNHLDLHHNPHVLDLMGVGSIFIKDNQGQISLKSIDRLEIDKIHVIPCAVSIEDETEILDILINNKINSEEKIILQELYREENNQCKQLPSAISVLDENPGYLRLEVELDQDSWVLWSQTWYPGWKGRFDGEVVPVYRANYLFQAIRSSEGKHELEFIYQPASIIWGAGLTAAGIGVFIIGWKSSRKKENQE
ncbi:MAG: hypothetical protein WBB69_01450 [Anaerolineales bacterium]